MTRSRIIVVLLFIVAFGAGLSVGKVWRHPPGPSQHRGPSWLSDELRLSPEQRKAMLDIWDKVNHSGFDEAATRQSFRKQRGEAIAALVPQDKQDQLKEINDNYSKNVKELSSKRHQRFVDAIEKTKAVLNAEQRTKYEAILAKRESRRRRGGPGRSRRSSRGSRGDRTDRQGQQGPKAGSVAPATTQPAGGPEVD